MKQSLLLAYMDTAKRFAEESQAVRLKVGCVVVKNDTMNSRIISQGWNGMPAGDTNVCETQAADGGLVTKPEVLHAERNALDKLTRSTDSSEDAMLFCTHSPCLECAKSIYGSGIKEVYYGEIYRSSDGIDFLASHGVTVNKV